ncbi:MAG: 50S ribosomal protein L24 [Gemmatimonadetes bacterium]|nr:50S ribosomal protein L24 [Gemmatimonadota bacterium]
MGKATTRIVRGDRVRVIRGNHRDAEGAVLRVLHGSGRVVIQGVNMRKRHVRPTQANPEGGIVTSEAPIHLSNVMLVDPAGGEASRIRMRVEPDGFKERIAVKSGNPVPKPG